MEEERKAYRNQVEESSKQIQVLQGMEHFWAIWDCYCLFVVIQNKWKVRMQRVPIFHGFDSSVESETVTGSWWPFLFFLEGRFPSTAIVLPTWSGESKSEDMNL